MPLLGSGSVSMILTAASSPLPYWLEFVVALAPLVTVGVVVMAFVAYRQKKQSDNRADWWARTEKAIDMMLSEDNTTMNAGMVLVDTLSESKTVTEADRKALEAVVQAIVDGLITDSLESNARLARAKRRHTRRRARRRWVERLKSRSPFRRRKRPTLRRHTPKEEARG